MLPLQITLDGFMSYRDKTTISFEGARLWMLAGENGAGKSSVFDAMRWTLFGAHRGGKSGHEALINRGKNRLRVAFDLELDGKRFRLLRTLARAGRATWQIEEIVGETALKIPETDMREGYEKWVRENIGLGDETFCTAMYLAQNRGDAILSANPNQRYEMLAEIVDISAYAALHETAKTRASQLEIASRAAERAFQLAPGADAAEIGVLGETLLELNAQISSQAARREHLLGLEPLAKQWQLWQNERLATAAKSEAARAILADEAQIERDFARLGELEALLGPFSRFVEARARAAQNRREAEVARRNQNLAREAQARTQSELETFQNEFAALQSARQSAEATQLALVSESARLAPQLSRARQIAGYQSEIIGLEKQLSALPADLEPQIVACQDSIARLVEELAARAILARFGREKSQFSRARDAVAISQKSVQTLQNSLPGAQALACQAQIDFENTQHLQQRNLDALAVKVAAFDAVQRAIERFETVENQANCGFCGQTLTPEHAKEERIRLENEREAAQNAEKSARKALDESNRTLTTAKTAFEQAQSEVRSGESALQNAKTEQKHAQTTLGNVLASANEIWSELDPAWQLKFLGAALPGALPEAANRIETLLESGFPSPEELAVAPALSDGLERQRTVVLAEITAQAEARRDLAARLADRQNQLTPLLAGAQVEDFEALSRREAELTAALEAARLEIRNSENPLAMAFEQVEKSKIRLESARSQGAQLENQLGALSAAQIEIERALESLKTPQLAPFVALDEGVLRARLESLQSEKNALEKRDLAARIAALRQAQNRARELEAEAARLERALESVSVDARRAPQELQNEANALKTALEADNEAQKRFLAEKNRLEERQSEKTRLESEHLQAQNLARQHKTLADLLGPHELQRFLLREAENGIIDEANATLDRISGGELRLELRADDEEIAGARKGPPKVLDVTIFRASDVPDDGENESGARGQGMLPVFLSGSQRFRVSVALALGIGRYATRGGGTRLEAVIIDEGFGALDKIGRGEMIDELQILGQELRRVILVSHQEEFFEAFPNRYLIENNGETSSARLMVN